MFTDGTTDQYFLPVCLRHCTGLCQPDDQDPRAQQIEFQDPELVMNPVCNATDVAGAPEIHSAPVNGSAAELSSEKAQSKKDSKRKATRGLDKPTKAQYRQAVTRHKKQQDQGLLTKQQFRALKRQELSKYQAKLSKYNLQAWRHQLKIGLITKARFDVLSNTTNHSSDTDDQGSDVGSMLGAEGTIMAKSDHSPMVYESNVVHI